MSEETKTNETVENTEIKEDAKVEVQSNDKTIQDLVASRVDAELSKIKSSLDNAYAERDAAKKQAAALAKEKQNAEIEALEKAGKHTEVYKIQLDEIKQELETYKRRNTELSRDNVVKSQLNALDFRNEKAAKLAHSDIIGQLKQDSTGNWVHESGLSVEEAIANYAKNDANAFMFNVKANSGSNVEAKPTTTAPAAPKKDIKDMTTEEVLKAVESGQITSNHTWVK